MVKKNPNILPHSLPPAGLNRAQSAAFFGVSVPFFDKLVADHLAPAPRCVGRRKIWLRKELEEALFALPAGEADLQNDWDVA